MAILLRLAEEAVTVNYFHSIAGNVKPQFSIHICMGQKNRRSLRSDCCLSMMFRQVEIHLDVSSVVQRSLGETQSEIPSSSEGSVFIHSRARARARARASRFGLEIWPFGFGAAGKSISPPGRRNSLPSPQDPHTFSERPPSPPLWYKSKNGRPSCQSNEQTKGRNLRCHITRTHRAFW